SSRIRRLCTRQFRGLAYFSAALYLDQLVNQIQVRGIAGSCERRAHAERVNRSSFCKQRRNLRFIQIARGEYFYVVPSLAIELTPDPAAVLHEVAAIEPHSCGL